MEVAETLVNHMEPCDTFSVTDLERQGIYGGQKPDCT